MLWPDASEHYQAIIARPEHDPLSGGGGKTRQGRDVHLVGADKQSTRTSPALKQPSRSLGLRPARLPIVEERIEHWLHSHQTGKSDFRCLNGTTPLRREHRAHLDAAGTEGIPNPHGLKTSFFIKIALG
jgi:hypothetical protein